MMKKNLVLFSVSFYRILLLVMVTHGNMTYEHESNITCQAGNEGELTVISFKYVDGF